MFLSPCPRVTLWCLNPQLSVQFMLDIKFCTSKTGSKSEREERKRRVCYQTLHSLSCIPAHGLRCLQHGQTGGQSSPLPLVSFLLASLLLQRSCLDYGFSFSWNWSALLRPEHPEWHQELTPGPGRCIPAPQGWMRDWASPATAHDKHSLWVCHLFRQGEVLLFNAVHFFHVCEYFAY